MDFPIHLDRTPSYRQADVSSLMEKLGSIEVPPPRAIAVDGWGTFNYKMLPKVASVSIHQIMIHVVTTMPPVQPSLAQLEQAQIHPLLLLSVLD